MQETCTIVSLSDEHRADWRRLFEDYAVFYKREMTDAIADTVWGWLRDPTHVLECLVALVDGKPVGIAHYRAMPHPMSGRDMGFLDDLFVSPDARGRDVGGQLIEALCDEARSRGWAAVRWLTAEDNYRARTLYDRVAGKTAFILYQKTA
jgi:GNAT superfamily N-acetyltransferase